MDVVKNLKQRADSVQLLGFSFGYCRKEYLTLLSPFAIFEPQKWLQFMPFPACLSSNAYFSEPILDNGLMLR